MPRPALLGFCLVVVLAGAASGVLAQAGGETTRQAADRSGLPLLKEVLASMAARPPALWRIVKTDFAGRDGAPETDGFVDLHWAGPQQHRAQYQSMWGDGLLVVRNGASVLRDPLVKGSPATLGDAPEGSAIAWSSREQQAFGLFPLLLLGEAALPVLAPSVGSVRVREARGRRIIESTGTAWGKLEIVVGEGLLVESVSRIRESRAGQSASVEDILAPVPLGWDAGRLFETSAEAGVELRDVRTRKQS